MSVHDDGPPSWQRSQPKEPQTSTSVPATTESLQRVDDAPVQSEADALLKTFIDERRTFTSLDFKRALRIRCADVEPTPAITQEDCSKFLKRWFLERGEKDAYAFREEPALDRDGNPKPGKTVFNVYFSKGREEESRIEGLFEAEAAQGNEKAAIGFIAWLKTWWSR